MLRVLLESRTYLEAKAVHRMISHQHPTISTATTYRAIELFRRKRILSGVDTADCGEEPSHHAYLVCSECNKCHDLSFNWGIHLTQVDAICSIESRIFTMLGAPYIVVT